MDGGKSFLALDKDKKIEARIRHEAERGEAERELAAAQPGFFSGLFGQQVDLPRLQLAIQKAKSMAVNAEAIEGAELTLRKAGGILATSDCPPASTPPIQPATADSASSPANGTPWHRYGGHILEPLLCAHPEHGTSPVRLVDARYLVRLAQADGKLSRRQDLPEEAFISLEDMQISDAGGHLRDCLRIICISHPWLQPDHCDPRGDNLQLMAKGLAAFLRQDPDSTYGVFLDFVSLMQKDGEGNRTEPERALFTLALSTMHLWYSHPKVIVFKLTSLPAGYPEGFHFPLGFEANRATYNERGWCFFESSVASLDRESDYVLDVAKLITPLDDSLGVPSHPMRASQTTPQALSGAISPVCPAGHEAPTGQAATLAELIVQCASGRAPPLTPSDFDEHLSGRISQKVFTSYTTDVVVVKEIYSKAFYSRLGDGCRRLNYASLGWTDDDARQLSRVLCCQHVLDQLLELSLASNLIGDEGLQAIAGALAMKPTMPLAVLSLHSNCIGDRGIRALWGVIGAGALGSLTELLLGNQRVVASAAPDAPSIELADEAGAGCTASEGELLSLGRAGHLRLVTKLTLGKHLGEGAELHALAIALSATGRDAVLPALESLTLDTFAIPVGELRRARAACEPCSFDWRGMGVSGRDMVVLAPLLEALPVISAIAVDEWQVSHEALINGAAGARVLDLSRAPSRGRAISDADAVVIAKVLSSGSCDDLEGLFLGGHAIGDVGAIALAQMLRGGALPVLRELRLGSNQIGDAAVDALAAACTSLQPCSWQELQLKHNPRISRDAKKRIQDAMAFVGGQARF